MSHFTVPCPDRGRGCGSQNHLPENVAQINACRAVAARRASAGFGTSSSASVPPSASADASTSMQGTQWVDADNLNDTMSFDHVIAVHEDGSISEPDGIYADEAIMDGKIQDPKWEFASTGYSGQDRYHGPIMHNSESIGGGLAEDILDKPGIYVAVISRYTPEATCQACGSSITMNEDEELVDGDDESHCTESGDIHDITDEEQEDLEAGFAEEGWAVLRLTDEAEAEYREKAYILASAEDTFSKEHPGQKLKDQPWQTQSQYRENARGALTS